MLLLATRIRPRGRAELSGPQAAPLRPAPSRQGPPRPQARPRFSQWSLQHLSAISVVGSNVGETERVALRSSTSGNQKPGRSVIVTLSLGQRAVTENTADNLPPATAGGALDSGDRASACVSSQKSVLPRTLTRRTHPASSSFYSTDLGSQRPRTGSLYPSDAKYENRNTKAGR